MTFLIFSNSTSNMFKITVEFFSKNRDRQFYDFWQKNSTVILNILEVEFEKIKTVTFLIYNEGTFFSKKDFQLHSSFKNKNEIFKNEKTCFMAPNSFISHPIIKLCTSNQSWESDKSNDNHKISVFRFNLMCITLQLDKK